MISVTFQSRKHGRKDSGFGEYIRRFLELLGVLELLEGFLEKNWEIPDSILLVVDVVVVVVVLLLLLPRNPTSFKHEDSFG